MKIILLKSVFGLGNPGDIKEVAPSYARNFLIAKGMAKSATPQVLQSIKSRKIRKQKEKAKDMAVASKAKNVLDGANISISAKANEEGVLFAGVGTEQIVKAILKSKKIKIKPKQIVLPHNLKTLGTHQVVLKLSEEDVFNFFVNIKSNN